MPTISISDTLHYFYTDTGPTQSLDYPTLIVLHGLSFHAATFENFNRLACDSRPVRIISVNRRHYPGTTPFSPDELRIIISGTDQEKAKLLDQQGRDLAALVVALIKQCELPQKGGLTIAGWSLGTSYILALVVAINHLDQDVRECLQKYVTGFLIWDPPSPALGLPGLPDAYNPLHNESIDPEKQSVVFGIWISSYFVHGDIERHGTAAINCGETPDRSRKSTFEKLSLDELSSFIDFSMVTDCDTVMLSEKYAAVFHDQTQKALFDPQVRAAWPQASFSYLNSEFSPWTFVYAASSIREMSRRAGNAEYPIEFRCLRDANHFPMLDMPDATFGEIYNLMGRRHLHPAANPMN